MSGEGNPNHDPSNGQFASGGGSGGGVGKTPRKLRTAKRSTKPVAGGAHAPPAQKPIEQVPWTGPDPTGGRRSTPEEEEANTRRAYGLGAKVAAPAKGGVHATMNEAAVKTLMAQPPIHGKEAAHNAMRLTGVTPAPDLEAYAAQKTAKAQAAKIAPTKVGIGGAGGSSVGPREARKQRTARRAYFEQMANASDARNRDGADPKPVGAPARSKDPFAPDKHAQATSARLAQGISKKTPTMNVLNPERAAGGSATVPGGHAQVRQGTGPKATRRSERTAARDATHAKIVAAAQPASPATNAAKVNAAAKGGSAPANPKLAAAEKKMRDVARHNGHEGIEHLKVDVTDKGAVLYDPSNNEVVVSMRDDDSKPDYIGHPRRPIRGESRADVSAGKPIIDK